MRFTCTTASWSLTNVSTTLVVPPVRVWLTKLELERLLNRVKAVAFNEELFTDSQKLRISCPVLRSSSNLISTGGVRSMEWLRAC